MVEGKLRYEQDLYGKARLVRQTPGLLCRRRRGLVLGPIIGATNPYTAYNHLGAQNYFHRS